MRRNHSLAAAALALLALALHACGPAADSRLLLHRYAEVDASDWHSADTVWFDLPAVEAPTLVCPTLSVRALQSYPYRNLSLRAFVRQKGHKPSSRRVDFSLFAPTDTSAHRSLTFAEASQPLGTLRLQPHKPCRIGVVHIMRETDLRGVSHIGIKLTRTDLPTKQP